MRLVVLLLAIVAVSCAFKEPTLSDYSAAFEMDRVAGARAAAEQLAVIRVRRNNHEDVHKELLTLKHYIQLRQRQFREIGNLLQRFIKQHGPDAPMKVFEDATHAMMHMEEATAHEAINEIESIVLTSAEHVATMEDMQQVEVDDKALERAARAQVKKINKALMRNLNKHGLALSIARTIRQELAKQEAAQATAASHEEVAHEEAPAQ